MAKDEINIMYLDAENSKKVSFKDIDVLVSDNLRPDEILNLMINKGVFHIVQKSSAGFESKMKCAVQIVKEDHIFIKHPVSVILGLAEANEASEKQSLIFSKKIDSAAGTQTCLNEFVLTLKSHVRSKSVLDDARLIADELLTNAIFNAPYVDPTDTTLTGRQGKNVVIDPDKKPHLFAAIDDQKLIVGCTDLYGSLNIDSLTKRIYQGYVSGTQSIINFGSGGAGLGTYLIFNLCNCYYIAVVPGSMTTVCCTLPINMSNKRRATESKNMSMLKIIEE